jgi:hypothetical protein
MRRSRASPPWSGRFEPGAPGADSDADAPLRLSKGRLLLHAPLLWRLRPALLVLLTIGFAALATAFWLQASARGKNEIFTLDETATILLSTAFLLMVGGIVWLYRQSFHRPLYASRAQSWQFAALAAILGLVLSVPALAMIELTVELNMQFASRAGVAEAAALHRSYGYWCDPARSQPAEGIVNRSFVIIPDWDRRREAAFQADYDARISEIIRDADRRVIDAARAAYAAEFNNDPAKFEVFGLARDPVFDAKGSPKLEELSSAKADEGRSIIRRLRVRFDRYACLRDQDQFARRAQSALDVLALSEGRVGTHAILIAVVLLPIALIQIAAFAFSQSGQRQDVAIGRLARLLTGARHIIRRIPEMPPVFLRRGWLPVWATRAQFRLGAAAGATVVALPLVALLGRDAFEPQIVSVSLFILAVSLAAPRHRHEGTDIAGHLSLLILGGAILSLAGFMGAVVLAGNPQPLLATAMVVAAGIAYAEFGRDVVPLPALVGGGLIGFAAPVLGFALAGVSGLAAFGLFFAVVTVAATDSLARGPTVSFPFTWQILCTAGIAGGLAIIGSFAVGEARNPGEVAFWLACYVLISAPLVRMLIEAAHSPVRY